ncbi:LOW QUALITY PROTEIN: leukocyte immunoglobulin-like receptor subfamily B member 3 [Equus przewalskii]|uniref:LOW QUALITY PROTEIN: leukocyte immunoglobulin-like receptor subfamily B member 3 n=1 Tax=Equus przewalskii TaxID=9798 RepID=A0ABM4JF35_EQUPR
MSTHTAGQYQCAYHIRRNGWSERSDPLRLVVTGVYSAPSLSAHPGPVVASGVNVSLLCSSEVTFVTFHLLKEGGADPPRHVESRIHHWREPAVFPVDPVNTSHGGTYRCYYNPHSYPYVWSHPSGPLHLEVTGVYKEPSLSAQPGSLVLSGDNLTLQCRSEADFDRFALTRDEGLRPPQHLHGQHSPDFPFGHVSHTHGGQYRCYGGHNLSYAWSAPSAPLDILIMGMYKKPSLSAQPGPSASWGENVTLQCRSEIWLDTFHLSKEGSPAPPQLLRLQDTAAPFQANFTIGPVTSDHEATYRCYGSDSTSPHLLSLPSDPLELQVSVAAASAPEDKGLQKSSRPPAEVQEENLYAVIKDTEPEEDRQLDIQAVTSEDTQDVTYAQLNHLSLRRETTAPPSSPSRESPDEPSMYAALATH